MKYGIKCYTSDEVQERKNEKNVRNYNNFERRKYDMDSLESKLMEVNMNGKINKA